MANKMQIQVSKDFKNKKITVKREFDAPVDLVWKAWTESKHLDLWWAPKPYVTKTKSMDFRVGGIWLYTMIGPEGPTAWCIVEFTSIKKNINFQATGAFGDEKGNKDLSFPIMYWNNVFSASGKRTTVDVEISFDKEADVEQILAMGFEAGFTAGLENLDELLSKYELQKI